MEITEAQLKEASLVWKLLALVVAPFVTGFLVGGFVVGLMFFA